jgi:hypothetical protein
MQEKEGFLARKQREGIILNGVPWAVHIAREYEQFKR